MRRSRIAPPEKKRAGFSTEIKLAMAAAFLIVLMTFGRAHFEYSGIPALGYQGRRNLVRAAVLEKLDISASVKRSSLVEWFKERELDAVSIAAVMAELPEIAPLATSGPPVSKAGTSGLEVGVLKRLRAYLARNPAYREIVVADEEGRIVLSSSDSGIATVKRIEWFRGMTAIHVEDYNRWILAARPQSTGRARLAIGILMDPSGFFQGLAENSTDERDGLYSVIIGDAGRTLISSDLRRFPSGSVALPEEEMARLVPEKTVETTDEKGKALLARLVEARVMPATKIRILVIADADLVNKPLLIDRWATALVSSIFTLIGIGSTLWAVRRLFRPLRRLEKAMLEFSEGRRPELPEGESGETGLIVKAFDRLMSRVGDWRLELEKEVKARTLELEIRSAIDRTLADSNEDNIAYSAAVEELVRHLGAAEGLLVYYDGKDQLRAAIAGKKSLATLDSEEISAVLSAADSKEGSFKALGIEMPYRLASRLTVNAENVGFMLVGRADRDFDAEETGFIKTLGNDLAPLVLERKKRAKQEAIRLDAELALRRSEERLRTFFEESRDMIYSTNSFDVIASVNAAGLSLLGCSDRFDMLGRRFSEFALSAEDREFFLEKIRDRGFVSDYEIVLKRKDGSTIFCLETAHAVKDRGGAIIEIQGIVKDITERINKERELWRANLELAEANWRIKKTQMLVVQREKLASIGQLAAGIAHEINNPLGFLKSNHAVLQRFLAAMRAAWDEAAAAHPATNAAIAKRLDLEYVFSETGALVGESDEGFKRIMDIVKNLKNFARADSEVATGPYDLNAGIESTLVVARNEIKYVADVELTLGKLPPIEASGGEVNQVLLNIIVNSAQAIEAQNRPSKGRIRIETRMEAEHAICEISDDGPGIPQENRLLVFDPFYTTKEPGKGTGLGLSISYDIIVNKHGGKLTTEDSSLGGAMFKIELPLEKAAGASEKSLARKEDHDDGE